MNFSTDYLWPNLCMQAEPDRQDKVSLYAGGENASAQEDISKQERARCITFVLQRALFIGGIALKPGLPYPLIEPIMMPFSKNFCTIG